MKKSIYNIGFGIVLGIILAMIVLTMAEMSIYQLWTISFWLEVIILCMIPWCLKIINKYGYSSTMISLTLMLVSFVLVIIYGLFALQSASKNYWILMCVLHGVGLVSTLIGRMMK